MGMMDNLKTDKTVIEDTKDSLGGYQALASDIYLFTIKRAFITLSKAKAMALNLHLEGDGGEQLRSQIYMTSQEAKGCKNYYVKNGKKHYLPGFNRANALSLLVAGKQIADLPTTDKVIKLYDPTQSKEVDTKVDMLMDMVGKKVYAAVMNQLVDKKVKDENTSKYVPTGETRTENEIENFFREKDKMTKLEIQAKNTESVFFQDWLDRNKGQVRDKTTKVPGGIKNGAPRQTGKQAPTENLFEDD